MRQSRIYTPLVLAAQEMVELTGSASHYLSRVLRLSAGDCVTLFNGDGRDYSGEVCDVQRQAVTISLIASQSSENESPLKITLVQAISRGERMDHSLQKATELGVFCIQPVTCQRVEVRLDEKRRAKRLAHWQGVVISACEQSGRAVIPDVKAPLCLDEWVKKSEGLTRLVLDPTAKTRLSSLSITADAISLVVGPEGGFSEGEMKDLRLGGVKEVSLGPRVLRTETAGPAAIAVLQAVCGDF
jgi:16S rRNA (uracil1498-N3)-methyltransferase